MSEGLSENSDSDSYYDRLEQGNYDNNDIYTNSIEINDENESDLNSLDEESYFNNLDNAIYQSKENFLPEDNEVWSLIQSSSNDENVIIFQLVDLKDLDYLILLKQWLITCLPISSSMCGHVDDLMNSVDELFPNESKYLYVDNPINPFVIFLVIIHPSYEDEEIEIVFYSSIKFNQVYEEKYSYIIRNIINSSNKSNRNITLVYSKIDDTYIDIIDKVMNSVKCDKIFDSPCSLFLYHGLIPTNYPTLPLDYAFCDITINDASVINDTWAYKSANSYNHVVKLLNKYPCQGIKYKDNELVCWIMTYEYGAMGMLYTLPEHRGKGLAKGVITKLLSKWDRKILGYDPFVFISSANETSRQLYEKLGYMEKSLQHWVGYKYINKLEK